MRGDDWNKLTNGSFIHTSAIVEPWVEIGPNCVVHPYAVVGRLPSFSKALARRPVSIRELKIGKNVEIGCHAVLFGGIEIGDDSLIGDFAHIREGAKIGKRCVVGRYVGISYDSTLADDCRVLESTIFTGIADEGCFFGVGVVTSNDRNIDLKDYKHEGIVLPIFGKRVMVGSGANILAGVVIGDDAVIGIGAVVVDEVKAGERIMGKKARVKP